MGLPIRMRTCLPRIRSISLGSVSVRRLGWIMPSIWKTTELAPSNQTGTTGTSACCTSFRAGTFHRGSATALSSVRQLLTSPAGNSAKAPPCFTWARAARMP